MSVKIFLPVHLFYTKTDFDIYGDIQITDNNSISYFIVAAKFSTNASFESGKSGDAYKQLRHLGHILRAGPSTALQRKDVSLSFEYDAETPNIYLDKLGIKPPHTTHANVFLYDAAKVLQLHDCAMTKSPFYCAKKNIHEHGDYATGQCSDMQMLFHLLQGYENCVSIKCKQTRPRSLRSLLCVAVNFPLEIMTKVFALLIDWRLLALPLRRTVLYEHFQEWQKYRATGQRGVNIALDKVLGVCLMLVLLFFVPHPDDYLIKASQYIIKELRLLLDALKGSPIGLKLNVHLNNFFLDCFNYHIDLWAVFLDLIEPVVRKLFAPIALLGAMGFSFQLALLADLISLIGLHTHCFYIYAAVLYKVEVQGLQVLWKVVLGKRYNVLKKRVESHNYMNRQLYLATIFFTSLLFLFPTILVYYIVFTTLRLCIYIANLILQLVRRHVLEFPLQVLFKWLTGNFFEIESLQLQHENHVPPPLLQREVGQMNMSVFRVNVLSSSLGRVFSCESGVLQELTREPILQKDIFNRILKGTF